MKVVAIRGSLRRNSSNAALLRANRRVLKDASLTGALVTQKLRKGTALDDNAAATLRGALETLARSLRAR